MIDKPFIIDASVAIKWVSNEEGTDQALALLDEIALIFVPEIFEIEIAAILSKRVRMKDMTFKEALTKKSYFNDLPIVRIKFDQITEQAFQVASEFSVSFYDALYLASAVACNGKLITADFRLFNGLENTPFRNVITKLEY